MQRKSESQPGKEIDSEQKLKKRSSQPAAVKYYKKSFDQVNEMLQRKRTLRGELPATVTKQMKLTHTKHGSREETDLRIESNGTALIQNDQHKLKSEIMALTRVNKNSRPQSRKNSKKALQGITNEGVKHKIQRAIENNKEYINGIMQATPNNHYFQGHYQKMHFKQVKQIEQQKMQNALIVRNIKTLSKLSDSHDLNSLKKTDTTNDDKGGNYIPHQPKSQQQNLNDSDMNNNQVDEPRNQYMHITRNHFESQGVLPNADQISKLKQYQQLEYNSVNDEYHMSPQLVKTDQNFFPDEYLTQELAIKSFTELDVDNGGRRSQVEYSTQKRQNHPILQNKQNSLKIDSYNKFIGLTYGAPYSFYDPLKPMLPNINQTDNYYNTTQQQAFQENMYQSVLSQIAQQHVLHSMYSPNKIKTKQDLIKKTIIDHQLLDGTWILEPCQKPQIINEIVVKGQSVPNKFVLIGGVLQNTAKKNLTSARVKNGEVNPQTPAIKKRGGQELRLKGKLNENNSIDYKDSKLLEQIVEDGVPQKNVIRPQSKYAQKNQPKTLVNNNHKAKQQSVNFNQHQQRNSLDLRMQKHNSVTDSIKINKEVPKTVEDQQNEESTKCNSEENQQAVNAQINQQQRTTNYSFRPRRPIINPVEIARLEQERLIQMKLEAKEKFNQFSLQNKQNNAKYKYIVCPGNNSQIVKRCLDLRKDRWEETNDFDTLFNFKWHPISKGIKFDMVSTHGTKQLVNHFENHDCFTTKDQMFKNLIQHCESRKVNVFEYVPITFVIEVDSINYAFELEKFITYFSYIEKLVSSKPIELLKKDPELMDSVLTNINNKFQNHHQMSKDEKGPFYAKRKIPTSHFKGHNIWILKATGFNRGRGIHVFNKLEDLKRLIKEYTEGVNFENQFNSQQQTNKLIKQVNQKETSTQQSQTFSNVEIVPSYLKSTSFVIQKYVEHPLLLKKRKFDIRVWVVITQDGKCYLFKEGYIRTSCEEYSLSQESIGKAYVHLTNNAVQKFAENYGKFEDGNQLSFTDLQNILDEEAVTPGSTEGYVKDSLVPKIKDFIKLSIDSIKKKLKLVKNCTFELFGYDFIIDADMNPWLIEVNTNPCLEESSQLLCGYMPRMVNDMLKLTIDQVFLPKKGQPNYDYKEINVFPIEGFTNDENMWELLCLLDNNNANATSTNLS